MWYLCGYNKFMNTDTREQRGLKIAALARIDRDKADGCYLVPSQTNPVSTKYRVDLLPTQPRCSCADWQERQEPCKHIHAVMFMLRRETQNFDGSTTVTETTVSVEQTKERKNCAPESWSAYNAAQVAESREFPGMLNDLCSQLNKATPNTPKRGRPSLPIGDQVYTVIMKAFSTMSARRFIADLDSAVAKGHISKLPHYNSVLGYFDNPDLYPILMDLIHKTSAALASVETDFAVDSTGFTTSKYERWFDIKYNRFTSKQGWVKTHICTGVKTNVVTAVEIHGQHAADSEQLPVLVGKTAERFTMKEVSADKGYTGQDNHNAIAAVGATPFIAFKSNTTGAIGGLFGKMFHYFQFRKEEFLAHYHKRSNVETTVHMVKSKFGDYVRSKTETAQRNEVLAKLVCHNICCLISASYELGIQADLAK